MAERMREKLLPGFPRKRKFQTKEEVDAYFASDKIQCLLCGKWFKGIGGNHLKVKHGITTDDYKEMFGLPWLRGLDGTSTNLKRSETSKRNYENRDKEEMLERLRSGKPSPQRPLQPFNKDRIAKIGLAFHGRSRKYQRRDFEAMMERARAQQRTLSDVAIDPDMPSKRLWRRYAKKHPEIKEKYREILYKQPYSLQAQSRDFSPRFINDCQALRARGASLGKIAEALGAPADPVRRVLEDGPGSFRALDPEGPIKWRLEDYEAVLDRMRKEKRTWNMVCRDPDMPSYQTLMRYKEKHPEL